MAFIAYDIAASPASLTSSGLTMRETTDTVELAKYLPFRTTPSRLAE